MLQSAVWGTMMVHISLPFFDAAAFAWFISSSLILIPGGSNLSKFHFNQLLGPGFTPEEKRIIGANKDNYLKTNLNFI